MKSNLSKRPQSFGLFADSGIHSLIKTRVKTRKMNQKELSEIVRELPDFDGHEDLVLAEDPSSGLRAIIAVHNTFRGPGVGGTRMWRYDGERAALTDALRLSRGMTYKNAISELPFGGGKAVIMSPEAKSFDRPGLMRAFGRMVTSLGGRYFTAEDVGTSCDDMEEIRRETEYIFGLRATSGDPSPHTARGVFLGIQACVEEKFGVSSLDGLRIVVQGVGHVGYHLCALLHEQGADLLVTDLNKEALARCEHEFGAEVVAPDRCYDCDADVYAPCALGATVNPRTLERLKVEVIAGAANNQLECEEVAEMVRQKTSSMPRTI